MDLGRAAVRRPGDRRSPAVHSACGEGGTAVTHTAPVSTSEVRSRSVALLSVCCAVLLLASVGLGAAPPADATRAPAAPKVTGWMPYWATGTALSVVRAHATSFGDVSPFWYSLRSDSTAVGARVDAHALDVGDRGSVVRSLHAAGVTVAPSVTDGTGRHRLAALIANPVRRAGLVAELVATVVADGVDGIDLDLEGFAFADGRASWSTTRPSWVAFVQQLSAALAARHRYLDVTVPPQDSTPDSYWVYDPQAIGPYVHALRVMAYDYHVSVAGPIAPLPWVTDVARYAVSAVPASKVYIGVAAYGRSWVTGVVGTCPAGTSLKTAVVSPAAASAVASAARVTATWDRATAERTFAYTQHFPGGALGRVTAPAPGVPAAPSSGCTVTRTVWYDDAASLRARVELARSMGLAGVAVWSLDTMPAAAWSALAVAPAATRTVAATRVASPTPRAVAVPRSAPRAAPRPVATTTAAPSPTSSARRAALDRESNVAPSQTPSRPPVAGTLEAAAETAAVRPASVPPGAWWLAAVALLVGGSVGVRRVAPWAAVAPEGGRHTASGRAAGADYVGRHSA